MTARTPRLTRREFARALRLGLGRARIDARRHGLAGRADLLVARCLSDPTFDHDVDFDPIGDWYVALAREGGAADVVRDAVLHAASHPPRRDCDAFHAIWILGAYVASGDAAARSALLRLADATGPDEQLGADVAIECLGVLGWRRVARAWARRWPATPSEEALEALRHVAFEASYELGKRQALRVLRSAVRGTPRGRALADAAAPCIDWKVNRSLRRTPSDGTLAALERHVAAQRFWISDSRDWWEQAKPADRSEAWRRLVAEVDPERAGRRMRIWRRPPRTLAGRLFVWADHDDRWVRRAATSLLAKARDPRLRDFAIERLRADPRRALDGGILDLFERNARPADAAIVLAAFPGRRSRYFAHAWCRDALGVVERQRGRAWDAVVVRAYEESPCRSCRTVALEALIERRRAPRELLLEASWDAESYTRSIAGAALRGRPLPALPKVR